MLARGVLARSLRRALPSRLPAVRVSPRAYTSVLHARRSYATTTRATKPAATAKKPAKKTVAAKKAAPAKKKAAPAKKTAKKTTAKKPAAKKKPVAKKPVKRVRKELTPEEKHKAIVRTLRTKILKEPCSHYALSAFHVYVAEKAGSGKGTLSDAAKSFKELSPADIEHYNRLANERTAARRAEYKAWVESHTPDQIRIANNARNQLRRRITAIDSSKRPAHTEKIIDERRVSIPTAYNIYFKTRFDSGDFKGIKVTEAAKLLANEWKTLSATEKKKYEDEQKAQKAKLTA